MNEPYHDSESMLRMKNDDDGDEDTASMLRC